MYFGYNKMKDYYQILSIERDTDQTEIKAAAQAKANEVNEAFRVLNDPEQRRAYDASLSQQSPASITPEQLSPTSQVTTPPKFKVAGENRQRFKNMLNSWGEYLHLETPSVRDMVLFTAALTFVIYMALQLIYPPPIMPPSQPSLSLGTYSSSSQAN